MKLRLYLMFALYCCISLSGSVKASNEDRLNSDILSLGTYEQFIEPHVFRDEFGNSNIQRLFDVVVLLNAASERSEDSQCVWLQQSALFFNGAHIVSCMTFLV